MNGTADALTAPAPAGAGEPDGVISSIDRSQEHGARVLEQLFAAAQPGAVYSPPVVAGQYTVITASEISVGGGLGFGKGFGPANTPEGDAAPTRGVVLGGGGGM